MEHLNPTRPEVRFRQLCAIATEIRTTQSLTSYADWKEEVRHRTVTLGFRWPPPALTWKAIDAVDHVWRKRHPHHPRIGSVSAPSRPR